MKKLYLVLAIMILVAMVPANVLAAVPVFYCSSTATPPGDGSFSAPWLCSNSTELEAVVVEVCTYGYAILYQVVPGGYYRHTVEDPNDGPCQVTSTVFYQGVPPDTGVSLPAPLLIGGALAIGAGLLLGGFVIYRKRTA